MNQPDERVYWCIFCRRALPIEKDGVVVHDDVLHPPGLQFDEDEKPQ